LLRCENILTENDQQDRDDGIQDRFEEGEKEFRNRNASMKK